MSKTRHGYEYIGKHRVGIASTPVALILARHRGS